MAQIAPWAHDRDGNSTDPINLVSEKEAPSMIAKALRDHGWGSPLFKDDLYLHVGDQEQLQDEQVSRNFFSLANAFRRISRGKLPHPLSEYRVHLRMWKLNSGDALWREGLQPAPYVTVGSAHVEPAFWFHNPEGFEWAEKVVARQIRHAGWQIRFDDIPLGNKLESPSNNGYATSLWR